MIVQPLFFANEMYPYRDIGEALLVLVSRVPNLQSLGPTRGLPSSEPVVAHVKLFLIRDKMQPRKAPGGGGAACAWWIREMRVT